MVCMEYKEYKRMVFFYSVLEGAAGQGSPLRSGLNLQLRSHASPKLPVQECPMCPYSSDSPLRLEEHINRQHFDLTSPSFPPESPPSRDGIFNCPLCVTSFPNSSDLELHVNIEHKDILRYDVFTCLQYLSMKIRNNHKLIIQNYMINILFLTALQMEQPHNPIQLPSVVIQHLPAQYVLVHYLKIMTT